MRTLVAALLIAAAGIAVFTLATDGFRAATAEGVRRLAVSENPVTIPGVTMEDMDGRVLHLPQSGGKTLLIEFIYTTCPTICQDLGEGFSQVLETVRERKLDDQVGLMSISFDLENDTPEMLRHYAEHHGADGKIWKVVRPTSAGDLEALLATFGVKVLPDPLYGFQHNVAIHVVDQTGKLARIVDADPAVAIEALSEKVDRL